MNKDTDMVAMASKAEDVAIDSYQKLQVFLGNLPEGAYLYDMEWNEMQIGNFQHAIFIQPGEKMVIVNYTGDLHSDAN